MGVLLGVLIIVDLIGNLLFFIICFCNLFFFLDKMGVDVFVVLVFVEGIGWCCEGIVEDGWEDCGVVFLEGGGGILVLRIWVVFFLGFGVVIMYLLVSRFWLKSLKDILLGFWDM